MLISFILIVYCYNERRRVPWMYYLPCCADTHRNGLRSGVGGETERQVWSRKQRAKDSVRSDPHSNLGNSSAIKQESVRLRTVLLPSPLKASELCVLGSSCLETYVIFISLRHPGSSCSSALMWCCVSVSSARVILAVSLVCLVRYVIFIS